MADKERGVDIEPPMACVSRVLKAALPENISLTKEARSAFSRAVAVFIFYVTHCANEISRENKRQTMTASDVLRALRELGYEDFEKPLEEFLELHKEAEESRKAGKKNQEAASSNKEAEEDMEEQPMDITMDQDDDDTPLEE